MKSIAGFLVAQSGRVQSDGVDLIGLPPYEVARLGVKYVPQDKKVFYDLTVRENLELGSYATQDYDWDPALTFFPKLKILMDRKAGFLSGGERQMLMIGRAILGSPKVLLIDEATEGLAPSIVSHLKQVFTELSKRSAVLIVEQNLPLVCAISDRVYALKEGRLVAELTQRDQMKPKVCEDLL
jgi:ABC-type branched-subunit amino acid transport system ATPase component